MHALSVLQRSYASMKITDGARIKSETLYDILMENKHEIEKWLHETETSLKPMRVTKQWIV